MEWERRHLTGLLTPVRWVVHAFSTIWLAVILLSLVTVYAVMASVPVGVLFKAPTYLIYGATLLGTLVVVGVLPVWGLGWLLKRAGVGRAARFAVGLIGLIAFCLLAVWLWEWLVWPHLRYDPVSGRGLMLWAAYIEEHKNVTLRRLPGMEMTELEFYGWWPFVVVLWLFVINMAVATVRRIEFRIEYLGVLTVHSGIITLALGSAYYSAAKQEGNMLLWLIDPVSQSMDVPPPAEHGFFDNTQTVLRVSQRGIAGNPAGVRLVNQSGGVLEEQRLINGLPRYNEYNLGALDGVVGRVMQPPIAPTDHGRTLDIAVPSNLPEGLPRAIDDDLRVRIVGYAPYAEENRAWMLEDPSPYHGTQTQPVRFVTVSAKRTGDDGQVETREFPELALRPRDVNERSAMLLQNLFEIHYSEGLSDERWADLKRPMPDQGAGGSGQELASASALHVRLGDVERTVPVVEGRQVQIGSPLWTIMVVSMRAQPTVAHLPEGYERVVTPEVVLRVTPPGTGEAAKPFDRYLFPRAPELNADAPAGQPLDLAHGPKPTLDQRIGIQHLDTASVQVYIDEVTTGEADPLVRAIVRLPSVKPQEFTGLRTGGTIPVGVPITITLGARHAHGERLTVPLVVPRQGRDSETGDHRKALVAVELSRVDEAGRVDWSTRRWLPFSPFRSMAPGASVPIAVPDGREVRVAFGRLYRPWSDMAVRLKDFEMTPYPHSTQARDFRSDLMVAIPPRDAEARARAGHVATAADPFARATPFTVIEASTSLNEPLLLTPPFAWDDRAPWGMNAVRWLGYQLGATRFKFSQSGWDQEGWTRTKAAADRGEMERPLVRWTILGVGNNPGIYIIAAGAVMMSVGIPYAFYVKPWIVQRRKRRIQAQLAAGTYAPPRGAQRNGVRAAAPALTNEGATP